MHKTIVPKGNFDILLAKRITSLLKLGFCNGQNKFWRQKTKTIQQKVHFIDSYVEKVQFSVYKQIFRLPDHEKLRTS